MGTGEQIVSTIGDYAARACLKIGDVSGSEGFWAAGKQFFRRNPGGFQGKIAPSRGQKTRRLGMLTFFKQALGSADGSYDLSLRLHWRLSVSLFGLQQAAHSDKIHAKLASRMIGL